MSERTPVARPAAKETDERPELARLAESAAPGVLRQGWELIREEKKWYLLPLLLAFLLVGGFIVLGASGAAPLLYTLF